MGDEGCWSKNGCLHYKDLRMRTISVQWHNFCVPIRPTKNHLVSLIIVPTKIKRSRFNIKIMLPQVIYTLGGCIHRKCPLGLECYLLWYLAIFFENQTTTVQHLFQKLTKREETDRRLSSPSQPLCAQAIVGTSLPRDPPSPHSLSKTCIPAMDRGNRTHRRKSSPEPEQPSNSGTILN